MDHLPVGSDVLLPPIRNNRVLTLVHGFGERMEGGTQGCCGASSGGILRLIGDLVEGVLVFDRGSGGESIEVISRRHTLGHQALLPLRQAKGVRDRLRERSGSGPRNFLLGLLLRIRKKVSIVSVSFDIGRILRGATAR